MLITKVEIENFYSHRNTSIEFDRGINMIVGPNGAGKSTILNAIRFAMFGKERESDPVMHGATFCRVVLEYQIGSDRFTVMRSHGQKQSNREASILKNGVQVATSQDQVSREVRNSIEMDQSVFEGSVFIRQGEIDAIVNQRPRDRKDFFAQILGIEKLSKASTVVRASIQRLNEKSVELQSATGQLKFLREDLSSTTESLNTTTEEISKMAAQVESLRGESKDLQTRRADLEEKVEEIRSVKKTAELLRSDADDDRREITSLENAIATLSDAQQDTASIESNPLFIHREEITRLPDIETRLNDYNVQLAEKQEDLKRLSNMQSDLAKLEPDYSSWTKINEEASRLKTDLTRLQSSEPEWVRTDQKKSDLIKKLEKLKIDRDHRKHEIDELFGSEAVTHESLEAKRESTHTSLEAIAEEISKKKGKIGSLNSRIKDLRHDLGSLEGKSNCPLCGTKLGPDHVKKVTAEMNSSISSSTREIEETLREINSLQGEKKHLDSIQEKLSRPAVVSYPALEDEIRVMTEELSVLNTTAQTLEVAHRKYLDAVTQQNELEMKATTLEPVARKYSELRSAIEERTRSKTGERVDELKSVIAKLGSQIEHTLSFSGVASVTEAVRESRRLVEEQQTWQKKQQELRDASRRLEERKKSLAERESKIREAESKLEMSSPLIEKHRSAVNELEELNGKINHADAELSSRRREEKTFSDRMASLSSKISTLEDSETRLATMRKAILILENLRRAYSVDGIQRFIRKRASEFITNGARQFLSSFSLDFDDLEVSEDFDITILRDGPIEISALSGGERISLAIALRMSISRYLDQDGRTNCFLMDEPTTYLDQERRSNLRDLLHYALGGSEVSPQIIMITHHTELTSAGDAVYEVSKKESRSVVTSY